LRHGIPSAIVRAAGQVLARPRQLVAFWLLNLVVAALLTAPLAVVLSDHLDHNLHGERMAEGPSWRWLDTVDRTHPEVLGDRSAVSALFAAEGVGWEEMAELSGAPVAVLAGGLAVFWLNALLHLGFLSTLAGGRRDARGGLLAGAARFALPGTVLAVGALMAYVATYALVYVGGGRLMEPLSRAPENEWVALGLLWARVTVTLLALLGVKLTFDLAKAWLVQRDSVNILSGNVLRAVLGALKELWRNGVRYGLAYLVVGAVAAVVVLLWWWLPDLGAITGGLPQGWLGLVLVFLLHQLFLLARIVLRLWHLGVTWNLVVRG